MLTLIKFGHPLLRKKAKRLTLRQLRAPTTQRLIKRMFETIQGIGVGLAAPQIGKSIQLAVIDIHPLPHRPNVEPYRRVIINPKILGYSKEQTSDYEGCLSFNELRAKVRRSKRIKVRFLDENGVERTEWVEGFIARAFQHEIDHLNGVLFVDGIEDTRTIVTTEEFNKRIRKR